ncbi:MAG: hypothetical protein WA633_27280 [Stellaceae bacterium]
MEIARCNLDCALYHTAVALDVLFQNGETFGDPGKRIIASISSSRRNSITGLRRDYRDFVSQIIGYLLD